MTTPRAVIFDVNETLLDLSALDPLFEQFYGDASTRLRWFTLLKEWWLVGNATGTYRPFDVLVEQALLAIDEDKVLTARERKEFMQGLTSLPPHEDVRPALKTLSEAPLRVAALTNGTDDAVKKQLTNAGLLKYFDLVLSTDSVQRHKPDKSPYLHAAKSLNISVEHCVMIAAHDWDIAGAAEAGLQTAFIERPGAPYAPIYPTPTYRCTTLHEVAELFR